MTLLLAVVVGVIFGCGLYLMMRRTMVQLLIGLAMIGNGANLLIFMSAGMTRGRPPLVPDGAEAPVVSPADPVAQALILTAIVISFGVIAFTLALTHKTFDAAGETMADLMESDR
jgi:multicomponent Na+:H+ antiporter subunit C